MNKKNKKSVKLLGAYSLSDLESFATHENGEEILTDIIIGHIEAGKTDTTKSLEYIQLMKRLSDIINKNE